MPASSLRKSAQHLASNAYIFYMQERTQLYCARAHPYMHTPTDACVLLARAKKRCASHSFTRAKEMRAHTCARLRDAPPLRDAKMGSQDAATGDRDSVSQLFVLSASFSPTIRDEREGGSGYKRAPSS